MSLIVDQFARLLSATGRDANNAWGEIAESGFLDLLVSEEQGGAGLPLSEAFPLGFLLGSRAIDLPVLETMIARSLLNGDAPAGMIVLADRRPWRADVADRAIVLTGADRVSGAEREVSSGAGLARVSAMAAAAMACRMAGAIQSVTNMTISYALARKQFGREIARFQAVQQQIAVMAEETAAAAMAASASFASGLQSFSEDRAAVAKLRTCQAADIVVAIGHAVHGAIGVSEEYALGRHAAQLRMWRDAFGGRSYWEAQLGRSVLEGKGRFLDSVRFESAGN